MIIETIKVIIVTYNSVDQIIECLNAFPLSTDKYLFDITIVDNGSTDATLQKIRIFYPSLHIITNTNLGYAQGNNLGIREALENVQKYKAILILNPDATLTIGAIDLLADALFSSEGVGGVSPDIVKRSGNKNYRHKTLFGLPMNKQPLKGRNVVISDRLHGWCMLLRPEVFQKIGFIDEQYFLYWEELDFSLRAIKAGFKLYLCYDVLIHHGEDNDERQHRIYYMWRNQFRFAKKNFIPFFRVMFFVKRGITSLKDLLILLSKGRLDLIQAAIAGLVAGLRGELGKSSSKYAEPLNPNRSKR